MDDPAFSPGFRFSALDAVVLLIGAVATAGVASISGWIGAGIGFVVLHFFLFCNVLRMSRPLELVWAGVFATAAASTAADVIAWPAAFGLALLTTVVVATIEIRRPDYHGVGWRKLNPQLPAWWQSRN